MNALSYGIAESVCFGKLRIEALIHEPARKVELRDCDHNIPFTLAVVAAFL